MRTGYFKPHFPWHKLAFIISFICAISLAAACIILCVNDEVIPGEGQDPIVSWLMIMSFGVLFGGVCSIVSLYEHLSLNKTKDKALPIFITSVIFVMLSITCGVMSLKTMTNYGPGLGEQPYYVEEAGFSITFPSGLTLIEETSEEEDDYYRLYAFSKSQAVVVHIRTAWTPEGWTDAEFDEYVTNEFGKLFTKEVFEPTKTIRYDGFNATRMAGKTDADSFNEFRAIYDILHGTTYIRVVVLKDNLSGKPDESSIDECDRIVSSIRFDN